MKLKFNVFVSRCSLVYIHMQFSLCILNMHLATYVHVCMVCIGSYVRTQHCDVMCGVRWNEVCIVTLVYASDMQTCNTFHPLPSLLFPPSLPSSSLSPQLETKCFLQQEQLDMMQEQLSAEQERSHTAVSSLQKELALRMDQVWGWRVGGWM